MPDLSATIAAGFVDYYARIRNDVHKLADSLSTEQFWRRPFAYGNSVGHLILHLTGNLNYYIGAQIAVTGYISDRDREFTEPEKDHEPKDEVLAAFDRAVDMVIATIRNQSAGDWSASYSAAAGEAA